MRRRFVSVAVVLGLLALAGFPLVQAQGGDYGRLVFLPLQDQPLPTPTATPQPSATPLPAPPPALEALVLLYSDLPTGFYRTDFRHIGIDEAAKAYPDPKAALAAFKKQGRGDSIYAEYEDVARQDKGYSLVENQVIRYAMAAGASAGLAYNAKKQADWYALSFPSYGDEMIALGNIVSSGGRAYFLYSVSVRVGRHITIVQAAGLVGEVTSKELEDYVQIAVDRLPR